MGKVGRFVAGAGIIAAGFLVPGGGFFASKFGLAIISLSRVAGLGLVNSAIARRPSIVPESVDARFQTAGPQQPERIIYGETELALAGVWWGTPHDAPGISGGKDQRKFVFLGSMCVGSEDGTGIEGVTHVIFDDEIRIQPLAGALLPTGDLGTPAADFGDYDGHIRYGLRTGSDTQVADAELVSLIDDWTTEHRGRGVADLCVEMFADFEEEKFVDGLPTIIAHVRGRRVFDPRDSQWKWSKNPALCARDYLLSQYGYNLDASDLDEDLIIEAANICDSDPGNGRGAPMFECNGWLYQAADPEGRWENLTRILASCRGYPVFQDGKYGIRINQADAVSGLKFTDDDLSGEIEAILPGSRRKPNSATVRYMLPGADYQAAEVTLPDSYGTGNPYLTEDSDVPSGLPIDLPMVTDRRQAEDIGFVSLKEARSAPVRWVVNERGLLAIVGDIVELSSEHTGWTDKPIRLAAIKILTDSNLVELTGFIHEASAYDLDPNSTVPGVPGTDLPDPTVVDPPTNAQLLCNAGIYLPDGSFQPRLKLTWDASPSHFLEHYEVSFREIGDVAWLQVPPVPANGDREAFIDQVVVGGEYVAQVVAVNRFGVHSTAALTLSCTIGTPDQDPETIDGLDGRFTCLEGISLWWDPVITPPPSGESEFVWSTEIREQGPGATAEDRWAAGTIIDSARQGRWNWSFDDVFAYGGAGQNTYNLTLRRRTQFGNYSTAPPVEITLVNLSWPCEDFGEGGGPAQCPTLAPFDAAVPNRTAQAPGTVLGTPYDLVPIDTTGLTPGQDAISYCFRARVGPSDDVGAGDTGTGDGKMIRRRHGLVAQLMPGQPNNIKLRRGNVFVVSKAGQLVYEARQDVSGWTWAALLDPRLGLDADGNIDPQGEAHSRLWIQAYFQYEGTSTPKLGGDSRELCEPHIGDRALFADGVVNHMTSPFIGVTNDPEGDIGLGYWYFYTSKRGFFGGQFDSALVRGPENLPVPNQTVVDVGHTRGSEIISCGNPVHFYIRDGAMMSIVAGSAGFFVRDPITSTDAAETGPWYPIFGLWNDPDFTEVGVGWFPREDVCRDQVIRINSVGPDHPFAGNHYAALTNQYGQRAHAYQFEGAGERIWAAWRTNIDSFYDEELQTKAGLGPYPEYKFRWPANKIEIWDGPSWKSGSNILTTVDVPVGIWPGDVWDYHSDGGGTPGGDFPNANVTMLLEFLDEAQQVISTIEPPTVSDVAYSDVSSVDHTVPLGTKFFRFTPKKTGSANAWGETDDLQFNRGSICCEFSDPRIAPVDRTIDEDENFIPTNLDTADLVIGDDGGQHVTRLYCAEDDEFIEACEIIDALDEQGQGAVNLLTQSNEERQTPSAAGTQTGTAWPLIDLDEVGINVGDTLSIRVDGRTEV